MAVARTSPAMLPPADMLVGAGASIHLVYDHVRHSVLYLGWAAVYLFLVFVVQPCSYFVVTAADSAWRRLPCNGFRDWGVRVVKGGLRLISPDLAQRCFSYKPFGEYLGEDASLAGRKKLPLHSVSLQGCAWMLPYHIGVCEGKFPTVASPTFHLCFFCAQERVI